MGGDGLIAKKATELIAEIAGGGVAAAGRFPEAFEGDRVEVAGNRRVQTLRSDGFVVLDMQKRVLNRLCHERWTTPMPPWEIRASRR